MYTAKAGWSPVKTMSAVEIFDYITFGSLKNVLSNAQKEGLMELKIIKGPVVYSFIIQKS